MPFKIKGKGAWMSWAVVIAGLSGAFTCGVWATNLQAKLESFQAQISELKESQKAMQNDIGWLVRERGGRPESKTVAVNQ